MSVVCKYRIWRSILVTTTPPPLCTCFHVYTSSVHMYVRSYFNTCINIFIRFWILQLLVSILSIHLLILYLTSDGSDKIVERVDLGFSIRYYVSLPFCFIVMVFFIFDVLVISISLLLHANIFVLLPICISWLVMCYISFYRIASGWCGSSIFFYRSKLHSVFQV